MSLQTAEHRSSPSEDRATYDHEQAQGLMTPARRAALEALEREFAQLLKAQVR